MSKTYDCFPFFNELDLLEIRLNELNEVVDYFVIIEATRTYTNKPKELLFQKNQERYAAFAHKIKYVIVDDYPGFFRHFRKPTPWDFERNQRGHVKVALKDCQPEDVLILSDIDEIPRKEKILEFKKMPGLKVFEQKMYYYFLNCFVQDYDEPIPLTPEGYKPWRGTIMLNFKDYTHFEDLRTSRNHKKTVRTLVRDGGWHYSWLGGVDSILKKIEAYSHTEHDKDDYKNPAQIRRLITSGQDLFGKNVKTEISSSLPADAPAYVKAHQEKFKNLILE